MRKWDREYIQARIDELREATGLNFVLYSDNLLGIRMTPGGGINAYKHGTAKEIMTYLDGMTAMLDRIPRDKKREEYLVKTARKAERAREKERKAREKEAKKSKKETK